MTKAIGEKTRLPICAHCKLKSASVMGKDEQPYCAGCAMNVTAVQEHRPFRRIIRAA